MSRARDSGDLIPLDLEIESTLRRIRRDRRQNNLDLEFEYEEEFEDMAEEENNRTLMDLHRPLVGGYGSSIVRPAVQVNTFELKPAIIQMIQMQVRFGGAPSEDPNAHLEQFLSICDTFKFNGAKRWGIFECRMDKILKDAEAVNDSLYRKTPTTALEIISNMAESNVGWQDNRRERKVGFLEMDALTAITAKLDGLNHQVSQLQANKSAPLKQPTQQRPLQQAVRPPHGAGCSMPPGFNPSENKSNFEDMFAKYIAENDMRWQNHDAMMQRVETQLGQLTNQLSSRAPSSLPSDTVKNPKEVNVIFVQQAMTVKIEEQEVKVEHKPEQVIISPCKGKKGKEDDLNSNVDISSLTFPQRARQLNFDHQFKKFLEIFKKLHVNIHFAYALAQIPSYTKFLKEILANKRKLNNLDTVSLNEECSAVLLNKLPPKLQDPGSFSLPCAIGSMSFDKVLCDLGASINLMLYSLAKKLGIGVMEPTTMSLKLADRSIKYPKGIMENVLLKVDEFIFPVDFVVLDMDDDRETPLILGRPFLATSRALIDVQKGKLILRLNEKQVEMLREKSKLARLLRDYIRTMGWSIDDIKGLGPIVMVDDSVGRNRGVERHRSTTSNDPP
ncbi:uncharacterized protein [Henckelia pumila]|uniref:uncharacterized protein n=1 Tax=Henckelia pumila TaxID=405737 RepID=UPI003C6DC5D8